MRQFNTCHISLNSVGYSDNLSRFAIIIDYRNIPLWWINWEHLDSLFEEVITILPQHCFLTFSNANKIDQRKMKILRSAFDKYLDKFGYYYYYYFNNLVLIKLEDVDCHRVSRYREQSKILFIINTLSTIFNEKIGFMIKESRLKDYEIIEIFKFMQVQSITFSQCKIMISDLLFPDVLLNKVLRFCIWNFENESQDIFSDSLYKFLLKFTKSETAIDFLANTNFRSYNWNLNGLWILVEKYRKKSAAYLFILSQLRKIVNSYFSEVDRVDVWDSFNSTIEVLFPVIIKLDTNTVIIIIL